ncbi:rhomboid family intramembrane serine protease [Mucilaginibacter conchicola]|uniref:Rhomboid family intramembrane serine protease n=1 Tax=Mucilaginibacter conchicola TaxID=2303333 RepID=A0A372NSF3_9SPHI|nr:rhomboid family intramembrane serine protease [Mucilaginibacter conchicola]RFZ91904.1 rhomboid family intramembrane serine protease [Mucilaginibacter conchicola]
MSTLWQDIQYKMLKSRSSINLLIGINIVVFLLVIIPFTGVYTNQYLQLFAAWPQLVKHIWTPITYMFMNDGLLPVIFNMLWLYWMGRIFEEYLNHKRLVALYLFSGLVGALLYIATYNALVAMHAEFIEMGITGASVSIMGVMVATVTLLPDYELSLIIIGRVKLKWVCVIYVVLALVNARGSLGTEIAQIGGGLIGFIYIKQLQRGNDWLSGVTRMFDPKPAMRVVSTNYAPKKAAGVPQQEEVDRILDKISASGYDSLSKQEKESLDSLSKH